MPICRASFSDRVTNVFENALCEGALEAGFDESKTGL